MLLTRNYKDWQGPTYNGKVVLQPNSSSNLNSRAIGSMVKSPVQHKEPIIWGLLYRPYLETDMEGFKTFEPCGGLFLRPSTGLLIKRKICFMENSVKKYTALKVLLALLPALIFCQNYAWMTINAYLGIGFLVIWALMIWSAFQFTERNHILERLFRLTEIAFFLLPLSAIVLTAVLGAKTVSSASSGAEQTGAAIGIAIGGTFTVVLAFIVGLIGGIIMHLIANKYDRKAEASGVKQLESRSTKYGIILPLVGILVLVIIVGSVSSAQHTRQAANEKEALSNSLQQGAVAAPAPITTPSKVTLEITKKDFYEHNYQDMTYEDKINMSLKFTNQTDKDIQGVQGILTFYDIFDTKISATQVSYDKPIKAHESKVWESSLDYNEFVDEDVKLRNTELSNLKYKWEIATIVYADGSKEAF